jgi:hypothetical protein
MILKLILALIAIESGGNPRAIGDHRQAHGQLQIHRSVVRDVNRFAGTHYRLRDAYSPSESFEICRLYLEHYATAARLGHEPTPAEVACIWNAGPLGWKNPRAAAYGERVQNYYEAYLK